MFQISQRFTEKNVDLDMVRDRISKDERILSDYHIAEAGVIAYYQK